MKRINKKTSKDNNQKVNRTHMLVFVILFALSAYMAFMTYTAYSYWQVKNNDFTQVRSLIIEAAENLYNPVVIGPLEKKQYIHEASVRFNLPEDGETFRYHYSAADENGDEPVVIQITSNHALRMGISNLGADKKMFDRVSEFQRCSKMFLVTFGTSDQVEQIFSKVGEKTLSSGKTVQLYRNASCDKMYRDNYVEQDSHEAILKSIESY